MNQYIRSELKQHHLNSLFPALAHHGDNSCAHIPKMLQEYVHNTWKSTRFSKHIYTPQSDFLEKWLISDVEDTQAVPTKSGTQVSLQWRQIQELQLEWCHFLNENAIAFVCGFTIKLFLHPKMWIPLQ